MRSAALGDLAAMALRNLARHRVKTVITTLAVAVSVASYVFVDAWILGMNLDSRRNIVIYESGAAKIQTAAYFARKDELPMYEGFSGWEALARALERAGYDSAPRFVFTGTLHSRSGSAPLVVQAVDPGREARLLRYTPFMEAGAMPKPGTLGIAVGSLVAEKLGVGIPRRLPREELAELVSGLLPADAAFVEGLFVPVGPVAKSRDFFAVDDPVAREREARLLGLRADADPASLARLWELLSSTGRMDVRIATTLDLKALPESIRKDRYEFELLPSLDEAARARLAEAYAFDAALGAYLLRTPDFPGAEALLAELLDADFAGALRHVNQLIDAVVVGVVNSPNPKTNGNVAFIPLDALQDESGLMLEGKVTELLVRRSGASDSGLPGRDETPAAIAASLGDALPQGLEVHGWLEYVEDYIAASRGDDVSSRVMVVLLFVLSFIGIANTMLMAILERTKETGMLRALGMTDGQIVAGYAIEAGLIGAIGSLAGILLGCLVNIPMVEHGIDYSAVAKELGGDFGYRITSVFRSTWNPPAIVLTGIVATLLSAAAAVPPTLRALRMAVTDSLRFE